MIAPATDGGQYSLWLDGEAVQTEVDENGPQKQK